MLYKIAPLSVIQDIKQESLHVKWLSLAFISAVVLKLTHLLQRNWILSLGGLETTLAGQMVPGNMLTCSVLGNYYPARPNNPLRNFNQRRRRSWCGILDIVMWSDYLIIKHKILFAMG